MIQARRFEQTQHSALISIFSSANRLNVGIVFDINTPVTQLLHFFLHSHFLYYVNDPREILVAFVVIYGVGNLMLLHPTNKCLLILML